MKKLVSLRSTSRSLEFGRTVHALRNAVWMMVAVAGATWGAPLTRPISTSREAILAKGFTIDLKVDFDNVAADETLYEAGPVKLVFRLAGRQEALRDYDRFRGNYLNFPMPGGACPVLEATIAEKAGRVGLPLGCLPWTNGVHDVTLQFSPVKWAISAGGRADDDFPIPACPVAWPEAARETLHSPRVRAAAFTAPARAEAIPDLPGAPKAIARPIQYWTPDGHNRWAGDVAPATLNGKLHVFYLIDRRHHLSGAGTGRHQFAHLVSEDLVHWTELPLAVPIRENWQTCGTGTPFLKDGQVALAFGWHTSRYPEVKDKMLGGTYATSADGMNFTLSGIKISEAQNPSIYNLPQGGYELVTSYGGSIGIFHSPDLLTWTLFDAKLPFRGDCPSLFDWHGHRYLLQGFSNMAYSANGAPGSFVNWTAEPDVLYEGLSVPMVTTWKNDRRLYIGWLHHLGGWGGWLVFREVVAYPDGRLGLKWVPEIASPVAPRAFAVKNGARFTLRFRPREANRPAVVLTVDPATREASWADDTPNAKFEARQWARNVRIGGVRGIAGDYEVKVIAYYDAKSGATIFDAEIAGQRTLICRRAGRYDAL